ncbi:hypothetical protein LCGC14_1802890 [marine sediment metagenome]|uniref:Uncharacterized protein n=1 Tax=marine sediment metagenome TaxID=412755 RepID=A0A0F9JNP3_9ZZZZ
MRMKLADLHEAKYAEPKIIHLTGVFYTGYEGEYTEPDVTIAIKRGKPTSHGYDNNPRIITILGAVQSIQGGKIAEEIVTPNTTARLNREPEGWSLSGFTTPGHKQKFGDTWVLFDPDYGEPFIKTRYNK